VTEKPKKPSKSENEEQTSKSKKNRETGLKTGAKPVPTVIWAGPKIRASCAESQIAPAIGGE
jgi:hypothetical protein